MAGRKTRPITAQIEAKAEQLARDGFQRCVISADLKRSFPEVSERQIQVLVSRVCQKIIAEYEAQKGKILPQLFQGLAVAHKTAVDAGDRKEARLCLEAMAKLESGGFGRGSTTINNAYPQGQPPTGDQELVDGEIVSLFASDSPGGDKGKKN